MPPDALTELAMAGGKAVVQAAGKDGWDGFRLAVASWFGRGNARRERAALERLDRTAADLCEVGWAGLERTRADQVVSWQARFGDLLEDLVEPDRSEVARQLRALLAGYATPSGVTLQIGGDQHVKAERGGRAFGTIVGDVSFLDPPSPEPAQG